MSKMNDLFKRFFTLIVVTALIVTGVPTVAFYADETVEEQEVLSDVTIGENSNETITLDETIEKEEVLEEYQQYVEDGTYDERVAFMQELEVQKSNRLSKTTANVSKEGATAEQSQIMPYGGLMPSTGEVKALVFLVDFPDCRQTDGTTAEEREEQLFFGYGQTFAGFYNNSSYGKLKLDGDVYGYYTTQNNREYYNNPNAESIGRQELINELLKYYDDEIDYSDYDADKDGYIDALYIEYVGQDSGWGSFWWSYMTAWDGFVEQAEADGVLVHQYVWMNENTSDEDTYKHETGHLLGLIDYYDTVTGNLDGALGTFDMMYGNWGDHNALSKILLGWIEPIEVSDVTKLELRSSQLYPDAAIVYPNNDSTSDEYFVLEYVTSDAANYQLSSLLGDGGIRVWRVNAKLTEDGTNYLYNNDSGTKKFIEAVGICNYSIPSDDRGNLRQYDIDDIEDMYDGKRINLYYEGDELTPYSTPSSYIYGDSESFYGPFTTSGVVMNDIVITGSNAIVQISYENVARQDFEYSLEYTFESAFWAELTFDYEVTLLDESKITVSNGEKEIDIEAEVVYLPDYGFKKMYIFSDEKYDLTEHGTFTLKIEEGALVNEFGTSNHEITEDVDAVTIESTLIKEYERKDNYTTDIVSINDDAYFFCKYKNELSLVHIYEHEDGLLTTEDIIIFEDEDLSYIRVQEYGDKLLLSVVKNQDKWGIFCVYEVNLDGSYVLLYEEENEDGHIPSTYTLDRNIIVKKWDANIELVDADTRAIKVLENTESNKLQGVWTIGEEHFVVVYYDKILLVDSQFNIIKEQDKDNFSKLEKVVDVFEKDDNIVLLVFEQDGTDTDLSLVYYDENFEYVKREQFLNNTHDIIEGVKGMDMVIEYKDGYIIRMEKSNTLMRFSEVLSYGCIAGVVDSVTEFAFFDKEMNYVTSKMFWGRYYGSVCPAEVGDRLVYFNNGLYLDIYELDDVSLITSDRKIESLTLNKNELNLSVGETYQLVENYKPYNAIAEVIWSSSDENVAIVNQAGLVTIVGEGNATITVALNDGSGLSASCNVMTEYTDIKALEVASIKNQIYTGSAITPSVTIKDGNEILEKDVDYTLSYTDNINAGIASVTIIGKGDYVGTRIITFVIEPKDIGAINISEVRNQIYTGEDITPSIVVMDIENMLVEGEDYTVHYQNNYSVGTGAVIVNGVGNYIGTVTLLFMIEPKSIEMLTVTEIPSQGYTGIEILPSVVVKDKEKILVEDADYTVTYSNNVNTGTATVIITGIGNYSGTKEVTFEIVEKTLVNATVSTIANQTYTGNAITPGVTVTDGSKTLVKDTDYKVTYSNNINAGTATVTITGIGNYSGTKEVTFTITAKLLSNAAVSTIANQTYTGSAITPSVTVTDGSKTLVKDTDYTVTYSNNVNAGTATVIITGKGNYSGTKEVTFIITAKLLSNVTVSTIANQTYTGNAITPSVTVTDGSKTLVKDTDYTVTYSNNINAGTATVTIAGKGNYTGTQEVTFTITAKSLSNASVSSIANQTYTGNAITPGVTVTDGSKTLVKDTDYTVTYSNNVNAGTATVTITGKGNYSGTKTVNFTIVKKEEPKPQVPTQITSSNVTVNESSGSISKITIGTSVQSFKAGLNENNYVKVYQNSQVVSDSSVLATGMEARVMDGNTVVKKYSIIVTGDTNGDGKMNITDMIAIKANILKKTLLNGVYEDAADVNGDGKINVTDFIKIKATLLKKDSIVGVAVK